MRCRFSVGERVTITSDNEAYIEYMGHVLEVKEIYTSTDEHPGFDKSGGCALYHCSDLVTGKDLKCDLYDWELKKHTGWD